MLAILLISTLTILGLMILPEIPTDSEGREIFYENTPKKHTGPKLVK